jgi:hypothetical protein
MSLKAPSFSTASLDVSHDISVGPLLVIPCDLDLHGAYPCRIALFYLSCSQGQSHIGWGWGAGLPRTNQPSIDKFTEQQNKWETKILEELWLNLGTY